MIDPEQLIAGWLDGSLNDDQHTTLQEWLKADDEHLNRFTDAVMFEQQIHSATTALEEQVAAASFSTPAKRGRSRLFSRQSFAVMSACLMALLAMVFWRSGAGDASFATLEQTDAALWQSGDLPTADGSRLGQGTLRLAEGLATLQFDSGAEVILEAPATLMLMDSMNCKLIGGTAISDIPDSALGFRMKTPSADIVDYGTRFAVSVYEETGETHTQVIEGLVQVEYARSDEVVELRTGQRNIVIGETLGQATDEAESEPRTFPSVASDHGHDWLLLESVKDAYTGRVQGHESDVLLYVKNAIEGGRVNRTSYLGFSLGDMERDKIAEAELLLYFAPTGWGFASHVPDATFSVYGLVGEVPDWDETILHDDFPGDHEIVHVGSFTIPKGMQNGQFRVRTHALSDFVRQHRDSEITLKVVRDTRETENGGLVHGFASRRHPVLPPPTLAIRQAAGKL